MSTRSTLAAAAAVATLAAGRAGAQTPIPTPPAQLATTGQADARATPDRATLTIAVETRASTAAAAGADNARRTGAVLAAMRSAGIASAQLTTSGYNVYPEQTYNEKTGPRVTGYVARNSVRVEVRKVDQAGSLIDAALGAGANRIDGLQFYASNIEDVRRSALGAAVANACRDAQALAAGAGGALGDLVEATSNDGGYRPPQPMAMMRAATADVAPTPVEPGEQTITVSVQTRWLFVRAGDGRQTRSCGTP